MTNCLHPSSRWLLIVLLALLAGCGNKNRLVVYADPWLSEYAQRVTAVFQIAHPETEIQLKLISTEVIVQHIRYGQPIDVILCMGSELYTQQDFRDEIAVETVLAPSQVVQLVQAGQDFQTKQEAMGTRYCTMMEASDRPMRQYVEQWEQGAVAQRSCTIIANFQRQAMDYMLRGWVPTGYMPIHFASAHPNQFRQLARGPLIPNAFTGILLRNAPHQALASAYFASLTSEKSIKLLGELKFLP
jgi:hypothetical protein